MKEKVCPMCGKTFIGKHNQKYCGKECSATATRERHKKQKRVDDYKQKLEGYQQESKVSLEEAARKAREAGLTYGQYMAREYAGQIKKIRAGSKQHGKERE